MTTAQMKIEFIKRGVTQRQLCKKWKLAPQELNGVVNKYWHSEKIEKLLAKFFGITVQQLNSEEEVVIPNGNAGIPVDEKKRAKK